MEKGCVFEREFFLESSLLFLRLISKHRFATNPLTDLALTLHNHIRYSLHLRLCHDLSTRMFESCAVDIFSAFARYTASFTSTKPNKLYSSLHFISLLCRSYIVDL